MSHPLTVWVTSAWYDRKDRGAQFWQLHAEHVKLAVEIRSALNLLDAVELKLELLEINPGATIDHDALRSWRHIAAEQRLHLNRQLVNVTKTINRSVVPWRRVRYRHPFKAMQLYLDFCRTRTATTIDHAKRAEQLVVVKASA